MSHTDHVVMAQALRTRAAIAPALVDSTLRKAAIERANGGAALLKPYEALVTQVAEASYKVTDAEVAAVRQAAGSDKAVFEVIMAAAIGAAMVRCDRAMQALKGATNASRRN
jgi:hypothetical protein